MAAGSVRAETVRAPQTGLPALFVDAPSDWTASTTGQSVSVAPQDHSAMLFLGIFVTDNSCDEIAANAMRSLGAEPYASSAPGTIGGQAATVYLSRSPGSPSLTTRLACLRVGAFRAAVEVEAPDPSASDELAGRLHELGARVRLEGFSEAARSSVSAGASAARHRRISKARPMRRAGGAR
jgi:hypothetical protein